MQDQPPIETIEIPIIYMEVFALMFISFLIGYIFAFYYQKSRYSQLNDSLLDDLEKESSHEDLPIDVAEEIENEEETITSKKYSMNALNKKATAKGDHYLNFERLGFASESTKDDLQRIAGIGPYTEGKLNDIGLYTYAQISRLKDHDIKIVTQLIRFFPDRIKNDKWTDQAKMFINQKQSSKRDSVLKA